MLEELESAAAVRLRVQRRFERAQELASLPAEEGRFCCCKRKECSVGSMEEWEEGNLLADTDRG